MAYTEIAMAVGNSPEILARNVKMMMSSGFQPYGDVQMLSGTLFGIKMAKGTANNVEDFMVTSDTTIQGLVNRVNRYLAQGWRRFGNAHFEDGAYISALAKGDFASDEGGGSGEAGPQGPVGPQGLQVPQAQLARKAQLAQLAQLARQALRVFRDLREREGFRVSKARQDRRVCRVLQAQQAHKARRVRKVSAEYRVRLALKDCRV